MTNKYIPIFLRHAATPRIEHFAILAGLEATVRGLMVSVMPLVVYDALGDAVLVSRVYFLVGLVSLIWGLLVPGLTQKLPRRWMYSAGCGLYLAGMMLAMAGGPVLVPLAIGATALGTVTVFVCFNAYVLDYVARGDLGRTQSLQMFYAATPWAVGPMLGVWLRSIWAPLPFIAGALAAATLLGVFWWLRLGNGRQISRARGPAVNPLGYLNRFFHQPRLVAGWLFAVIRSCGWWVYIIYLPIFCIETGLGEHVGGVALSLSNALLFITPLLARLVRRVTVRRAVRGAFILCLAGFALATLLSGLPWAVVACLLIASAGLVMLDAAGNLPFMMAVKPSERVEMAAVFSSYRDVSGIMAPGLAWAVLAFAPLSVIFIVTGAGFAFAQGLAARLHPRLGVARPSRGGGAASD